MNNSEHSLRSKSPSGSDLQKQQERQQHQQEHLQQHRRARDHRRGGASPMRVDGVADSDDGGDANNNPRREHRNRNRRTREGEHRQKRRVRRSSSGIGSGSEGPVAWARPNKSPGPNRAASRDDVASRQLRQIRQPSPEKSEESGDGIDELVARHRDANSDSNNKNSLNPSVGSNRSKKKKRVTSAAIASSHDIDEVISQFRDQCDMHMATLLELKNNITTTEKEVNVSSEKDKEYKQVRKWYSALVEKHTKLQKEHQSLQEDHLKLKEKFMSLKHTNNLNESMADISAKEQRKKDKKKKKKDKADKPSLGDVVWSRAGKITKALQTHQQLE